MVSRISGSARELVKGENLGHLATIMGDGTPQVTPVWIDLDSEKDLILVNTAEGRVKIRNMKRDPRVAISITNASNPYERVTIRGRVVEVTREGAEEHIDKMARKYLKAERYPWRRGETRLLVKISPEGAY